MTGAEALRRGVARLSATIPGAPRDARLLLAHAMGIAPDRVTLHLADPLSEAAERAFQAAIAARLSRQPVSQITGRRVFWDRSFRVTRDTLDPRPETETLIAAALKDPFVRVLDLGTGTGAILLTLLAERPEAAGMGTDICEHALEVARHNSRALGVADRAAFVASDWFAAVDGSFDLVVANPPYIAEGEIAGLAPEVRDWEPRIALTPGGDGLGAYRAIAAGIGRHLAPGGSLIVEIGQTQGYAVSSLFREAGLDAVETHRDMDGRCRIVRATAP